MVLANWSDQLAGQCRCHSAPKSAVVFPYSGAAPARNHSLAPGPVARPPTDRRHSHEQDRQRRLDAVLCATARGIGGCLPWHAHPLRVDHGHAAAGRRQRRHRLHLHRRQGRPRDPGDDRARHRAGAARSGRQRHRRAARLLGAAPALRRPRRHCLVRLFGDRHRALGHALQARRQAVVAGGRRRGQHLQGLLRRHRLAVADREAAAEHARLPGQRRQRGQDQDRPARPGRGCRARARRARVHRQRCRLDGRCQLCAHRRAGHRGGQGVFALRPAVVRGADQSGRLQGLRTHRRGHRHAAGDGRKPAHAA